MRNTLTGFSKVTGLVKNVLLEPGDGSGHDAYGGHDNFIDMWNDDFAAIGLYLDKDKPEEDTGFEIVERRETLPPRPEVKRASPVSPQRWSYHMDKEGRVHDKNELLQAIFKGVRFAHMTIIVYLLNCKLFNFRRCQNASDAMTKLDKLRYR